VDKRGIKVGWRRVKVHTHGNKVDWRSIEQRRRGVKVGHHGAKVDKCSIKVSWRRVGVHTHGAKVGCCSDKVSWRGVKVDKRGIQVGICTLTPCQRCLKVGTPTFVPQQSTSKPRERSHELNASTGSRRTQSRNQQDSGNVSRSSGDEGLVRTLRARPAPASAATAACRPVPGSHPGSFVSWVWEYRNENASGVSGAS
jgi:hypothetical protein